MIMVNLCQKMSKTQILLIFFTRSKVMLTPICVYARVSFLSIQFGSPNGLLGTSMVETHKLTTLKQRTEPDLTMW